MIDANVFLSYLFPSDKLDAAKRIFRSSDDPVTILDILEEVVYVGLSLNRGSKGFKLKGEIVKKGFCEKEQAISEQFESLSGRIWHTIGRDAERS